MTAVGRRLIENTTSLDQTPRACELPPSNPLFDRRFPSRSRLACEKEAPTPELTRRLPPPPAGSEAAKPAEVVPTARRPGGPAPLPAPSDVAAAPERRARTKTGLASKVLTKGTGKEHPGANDSVKVSYAGWTKDGKMFDASAPDKPATFGVSNVIPGWVEGLQLMVVGEKRRLWIPAKLAYGETPRDARRAGGRSRVRRSSSSKS